MEIVGTVTKFLVAFAFALVFLVGFLSVCNYQVQIVAGQGMQLIPAAVADERYRD